MEQKTTQQNTKTAMVGTLLHAPVISMLPHCNHAGIGLVDLITGWPAEATGRISVRCGLSPPSGQPVEFYEATEARNQTHPHDLYHGEPTVTTSKALTPIAFPFTYSYIHKLQIETQAVQCFVQLHD